MDEALAAKIARATSTTERSSSRKRSSEPSAPAATAAAVQLAHLVPPTFDEVRCSTLFSWNGVSSGCLRADERADRR